MGSADRWSGVAVALVVLLAVAVPFSGAGSAAAAQQASLAPTQVDADDVLLAIDIQADGDATWQVAYRVRLDDQNTTEAFEELERDIERNPENYTSSFRQRMVRTARSAENATGREMAVENVTVSAEKKQLPQEYGVVTYRFTWTNFAAVDGPRLRIGDALRGLFLDAETTLLITWAEQYRVVSVAPREPAQLGQNQVSWSGPLEFAGDEPALVLTTAPGTTAGPGPDTGGGLPLVPMFVALLVIALGLGAAYLYTSGRLRRPDRGAGATGGGPEDEAAGAPAEAAAEGAAATGESDEPPEELLSNEEQVLRLLEEHGGRMKQQQVVQELDWTEAKTSQVIGDLRDDEEVETFRIGRENVVTLPEETES